MKLFISLSVFLLTCSLLSSGIIKGNVVNVENMPMVEANITIGGTNLGSATNDLGNYVIKNIPSGKYSIKCSFIGHKDVFLDGVIVEDDSLKVVDFLMFPTEYQMADIEVEQDEEDINSLLYFRDLAQMELFQEQYVSEPEMTGKIDVKTKPGFWEMFRYYIHRIFN